MTDKQLQQINIAVAKADGWTCSNCGESFCGGCHEDSMMPNYTTSYDAILPVIQRQDDKTKTEINKYLAFLKPQMWFLDFKPPQLCLALLSSLNIEWKEIGV